MAERGSPVALAFWLQLRHTGVLWTPLPGGMLHYRARKGILTPALFNDLRQHKAELLTLLKDMSCRSCPRTVHHPGCHSDAT